MGGGGVRTHSKQSGSRSPYLEDVCVSRRLHVNIGAGRVARLSMSVSNLLNMQSCYRPYLRLPIVSLPLTVNSGEDRISSMDRGTRGINKAICPGQIFAYPADEFPEKSARSSLSRPHAIENICIPFPQPKRQPGNRASRCSAVGPGHSTSFCALAETVSAHQRRPDAIQKPVEVYAARSGNDSL